MTGTTRCELFGWHERPQSLRIAFSRQITNQCPGTILVLPESSNRLQQTGLASARRSHKIDHESPQGGKLLPKLTRLLFLISLHISLHRNCGHHSLVPPETQSGWATPRTVLKLSLFPLPVTILAYSVTPVKRLPLKWEKVRGIERRQYPASILFRYLGARHLDKHSQRFYAFSELDAPDL